MYAFQIFEIYNSTSSQVDTENVLWILPICMAVIPFVYFVRVKLYDKHVHGIDLEAMDMELQYYRDKENNELKKHGITPPSPSNSESLKDSVDSENTQNISQSVLSKILSQFKHSFQSLF